MMKSIVRRYFSEFDAKKATQATIQWIRDWFGRTVDCNAIIGISGGKNSSITAALLVEALGRSGHRRVDAEPLQSDIDMAQLLVDHLGIRHYTVNIGSCYDALMEEIRNSIGEVSRDSEINLPPRLRMSTLYAIGQSMNGRVANTCNLSEDWVGYSTRYGDAAGDFSPISSFTTAEIRAMGRELGVREVLIEKVPSDWTQRQDRRGQTGIHL